MSTPSQIREAFLAAVAATDVAAVVSLYHDDAVLIAPEGRYEGRDYIEAYFRIQFRATPDAAVTLNATHDTEGTLIAEWTFSGTHTGPFELPGGEVIPPTGKRVTQRGADVTVLENGRIREHRLYYDQLELIEQLGLQTLAQAT